MSSKIQKLLEKVLGDGARSAKFSISLPIENLGEGTTASSLNIICKGSSFPGKTLDTIPFMYKGRTIPLPGQHKYTQTWDLTFYLEENHNSRLYFMDWMQAMNNDNDSYYSSNSSGLTKTIRNKNSKVIEAKVYQLNFDMNQSTAVYTLSNCFPISVSDVTLGSDQVGSIGEYTVSFSFSSFIVQSKTEPFNLGV